jgi:hypothetical protein
MGWETRRGHTYYYRKERQGCRVVSTYCGCGEIATLFAELDALDRERRQQERAVNQAARAKFAELAATPPELVILLAEARAAVAEALTAAGYHQHKRQWRKRRGNQNKSPDDRSTAGGAVADHCARRP